MIYVREILKDVITHHQKVAIKRCLCGWSKLGGHHADHVADVYEKRIGAKNALFTCDIGSCVRPGVNLDNTTHYLTICQSAIPITAAFHPECCPQKLFNDQCDHDHGLSYETEVDLI